VDLAEHHGPGRWFVAAAAGGFVEAEGLKGTGKSEEKQRRGDEDADVKIRRRYFKTVCEEDMVIPFYTKR
jgi:hypothetical protein